MKTHFFCATTGIFIGVFSTLGFVLADESQKIPMLLIPIVTSTGLSYYAIARDDSKD